ncbi:adenosine deaminase-like growth [Meredithblackwellia eburnea MCA 4105]
MTAIMGDVSLEVYNAKRNDLIQLERARGHHHRANELSPKEKEAVRLIKKLRDQELETVWHAGQLGTRWLGMPFTASRIHLHESNLFALIREMPKGCILHCHLDAMNDPVALLRLALSLNPHLCISATSSLTSPDAVVTLSTVHPSNIIFSSTEVSPSIHSAEYVPNTPVPVSFLRPRFPGGESAFDAFVISKLVVQPQSVGWNPAQVWKHFSSTFLVSNGLLSYEPVWEAYIAEVFTICANDHVPYLECRINFLVEFITRKTGTLDLTHCEWVVLFQRALEKVKAATSKTDRPFWGAKIIYSTIRFIEKGEGHGKLRWYMEDCIALKKEFPDLIAAFDLVGWEDGLQPLTYYMEDLLWFPQRCKEAGVDIPYAFHAGETLTDGGKADMNLYDAILLGTKRVGHGFSLSQHPLLMEICKERNIPVECCPISNELLRYTTSASTHPLSVLLNNNVPVSLSCDDPQFFGNLGLSYDFYQVFSASEQMDIMGLAKLGRQSIEYSFMNTHEKELRLQEFDVACNRFLDLVIDKLSENK